MCVPQSDILQTSLVALALIVSEIYVFIQTYTRQTVETDMNCPTFDGLLMRQRSAACATHLRLELARVGGYNTLLLIYFFETLRLKPIKQYANMEI